MSAPKSTHPPTTVASVPSWPLPTGVNCLSFPAFEMRPGDFLGRQRGLEPEPLQVLGTNKESMWATSPIPATLVASQGECKSRAFATPACLCVPVHTDHQPCPAQCEYNCPFSTREPRCLPQLPASQPENAISSRARACLMPPVSLLTSLSLQHVHWDFGSGLGLEAGTIFCKCAIKLQVFTNFQAK